MALVPIPWPAPDVIETLATKSSGYFIYASTVVKFIDDKNFRPTTRLKVIMGLKAPYSGSPFAALDDLYTQILYTVPDRHGLLAILTVIVSLRTTEASRIEELLELEPGDVRLLLRGLYSVIGEKGARHTMEVVIHHASFVDFLRDEKRAGDFYIGRGQHVADVCGHVLKALSYTRDNSSPHGRPHISALLWERATFELIASSSPSPDLITLLRSLNPDLLFGKSQEVTNTRAVETVVNWLKRNQPQPDDLIQRWEDYGFMLYCQSTWSPAVPDPREDEEDASRIVSRASPSLVQILQAFPIVSQAPFKGWNNNTLLTIHHLLDYPWEELRTTGSGPRSKLLP
ncbi:hypothetical protein B0H12DRAFT_1241363 [Mycena haematopus]|nr:hypothetical protein B0H12DRAFT_1241363 [Mycena haematopus]